MGHRDVVPAGPALETGEATLGPEVRLVIEVFTRVERRISTAPDIRLRDALPGWRLR